MQRKGPVSTLFKGLGLRVVKGCGWAQQGCPKMTWCGLAVMLHDPGEGRGVRERVLRVVYACYAEGTPVKYQEIWSKSSHLVR